MSKEEQIRFLEYRILELRSKLPMLYGSEYYQQCYLIGQLEIQLKLLKGGK